MSQPRSGYVIEIPLGMFTSIEIDFEIDEETDSIREITSHMLDGKGVYGVPSQLEDLVEEYLATWLLKPHGGIPDTWEPLTWVSREHWQEQTINRLGVLVREKKATWRDDLDD